MDEIFKNYVQNQLAGEMKDADGSYLDPLAYYYISFDKSRSVNEFNHQILLVGNEDSFYEAKDRESLGYLKLEVKEKLSSYFDGKMTDSNKKTYNSFSDFFSKAWFNAVEKEKERTNHHFISESVQSIGPTAGIGFRNTGTLLLSDCKDSL